MKATITLKRNRKYKIVSKQFNDQQHMDNYIDFMCRKGFSFIGVHPEESGSEAEQKSLSDYVEAQENAYFDNFCRNNNI